MTNKIIAKFKKNALEEVRIGLTEFKEKKLIDIRAWVEKENGEFIPTKKGISLAIERFSSLKEAIEILEKALENNKSRKEVDEIK